MLGICLIEMEKQTPQTNEKSARKTRTTNGKVKKLKVSKVLLHEPVVHRRSRRQRIAPVAFWNGETVKYGDDGSLIGIENVRANDPKEQKTSNRNVKDQREKNAVLKMISNKRGKEKKASSKHKSSSDIDFSDSVISEPHSLEYDSGTKIQTVDNIHPSKDKHPTFCMGNDISSIILNDSWEDSCPDWAGTA